MGLNAKNRYQAFGIHFIVSLLVFLSFVYLIFFHWYPEPYFTADGGWLVLRIIIIVHLVIGPVLTLIIFKPGKKGLKFDLSAIATVQVVALIFGVTLIYNERPAFVTFAVDRFVLVSAHDVDTTKIRHPNLSAVDSSVPKLVFAKLPENTAERSKMFQEVMQGKPDLEFRAEYYEPFIDNIESVLSNSKNVEELKKISKSHSNKITNFINQFCQQECAFFPLVGKKHDVLLVLNKKDGSIVGGLNLDPWGEIKGTKMALNK